MKVISLEIVYKISRGVKDRYIRAQTEILKIIHEAMKNSFKTPLNI